PGDGEREVRVEAVQLYVEQPDARRPHARVARDRGQRQGAADRAGARDEEIVPRAELAGAEESQDRIEPGDLHRFGVVESDRVALSEVSAADGQDERLACPSAHES